MSSRPHRPVIRRAPARVRAAAVLVGALLLAPACGSPSGADDDSDRSDESRPSASGGAGPTESGVFVLLDRDDFQEVLDRTREVRTGRYTLGVEMAAGVEGTPSLDAAVSGAFDRTTDAITAEIDVDETFAGAPELAGSLPAELRGEAVEMRSVGGSTWMRIGSEGPWSAVASGTSPLGAIVPGVDQVLELLEHAGERIQSHTGGIYSGHIELEAIADADPAFASFAHLAAVLPPEVHDRLVPFQVTFDRWGRIESVEVSFDLAAAAEAVGEAAPEGAALRWRLHLRELDEPVVIAPPLEVASDPAG